MPWKPELYPHDWDEIEQKCKERAGWICERCGIEQRAVCIGKKRKRPYQVFLAGCHINHDTTDNRDENLIALCQNCHLHHDIPYHVQNCRRTKQRKRHEAQVDAGQLELFKQQ